MNACGNETQAVVTVERGQGSACRVLMFTRRVGIFAALANAVSLVLIAGFIGREALARIREPQTANGAVMIAVAVAAVLVNVTIRPWLHQGAKDDLNIRSAYLHMLGDAVSAFGVVIAGTLLITLHMPLRIPSCRC